MDNDYKQLFQKSVEVQQGLLTVVKSLEKNSKEMNDNFVLHQQDVRKLATIAEQTNKKVAETHDKLLKYLVWAILALIVVLGGKEVISFATTVT